MTKQNKIDSVLKWTATAILIVGAFVNSAGFYPLGPLILLLGGTVWLIVGIRWREASLIVTNGVMLVAGLVPLVYNLFIK